MSLRKSVLLHFVYISFTASFGLSVANDSFDGLQECPKGSDQVLSKCFTKVFRELQPLMANGIPEIGIEPLEPILVPELSLNILDNPFIKLSWKLNNVRIRGMSNTTRSDFNINTHNNEVGFKIVYFRISTSGQVAADGSILGFIPISRFTNVGSIIFDVDNWDINGKLILKETSERNGNVIRVNDLQIAEQAIKGLRTNMKQVVNPIWLENLLNNIFNRMGSAIFDNVLKDPLLNNLGAVVPGFMNPLFAKLLAVEYFSPDSDSV